MKHKHELSDKLERRLSLILQQQIQVKFLWCDNSGQHQQSLQHLCARYHIQLEYTAPGTPQQNDLVEQTFATEWTWENAMIKEADFTAQYCSKLRGEANNIATLLYNVSCNRDIFSPHENFFVSTSITYSDNYDSIWTHSICPTTPSFVQQVKTKSQMFLVGIRTKVHIHIDLIILTQIGLSNLGMSHGQN
jgi:hypothetical protein